MSNQSCLVKVRRPNGQIAFRSELLKSHRLGFLVQVFVFGPDNLIWELDKASATAENVLGRSHAAGIRLIDGGAAGGKTGITLVNGKAVPMHYAFKNGDVLDVDLARV